jgi:hypothetical protein
VLQIAVQNSAPPNAFQTSFLFLPCFFVNFSTYTLYDVVPPSKHHDVTVRKLEHVDQNAILRHE